VADRVELAFRRAAAELIRPGARLLVAVSGGGDSVALLQLLVRYAHGRDLTLHVAHLDHGLRRGSRADRKFVERLARSLDLPCIADRMEVARLSRKSESPEEAARRVRRGFLLQARKQTEADLIATGHNLDDQAETVLMRLVRGAGPTALAGISPAGPGPFVRPLLRLEREELRLYLHRRELSYREDPSNDSLRFDRNRVRKLIVPFLAETLNPRAARHIVKAARALRDDALFLDRLAAERFAGVSHIDAQGRLVVEAAALVEVEPPIATRMARKALQQAGADARRIGSRHIQALIDLARGGASRQLDLPSGIVARRDRRRRLVLTRSKA